MAQLGSTSIYGDLHISGYMAIHTGNFNAYLSQNGLDGCLYINPGPITGFTEGIRISPASNSWCTIALGCTPFSSGTGVGIWSMHRMNTGEFLIAHNGSSSANGLYLTQAGVITWRGNTVWHSGNDGHSSGLEADLVDGLHAPSFLRSDADDTFTGMLSVGSTSTRNAGMYGIYDSAKIGHIWSMGTGYSILADGSTFGTLYGMAYKHTNNTTGGTMAGGHQIVVCHGGSPGVALGMAGNVWTKGQFISTIATGTAPMVISSSTMVQYLNADYLDGQHGTYYYRKLAARAAGEFYTGTTAPTNVNRLNYDGYLYPTRVYNAWYNDYAEYFEKGEPTEPGDIVSLDPKTKKYIKSNVYADKFVRGVHSDEYGHCIGGDGSEDVDDKFTPIGLSGRLHVKIRGKAKAGQYIISYGEIPGVGIAIDEYIAGSVIGQCEEDKDTDDIGKVRMFIKYL